MIRGRCYARKKEPGPASPAVPQRWGAFRCPGSSLRLLEYHGRLRVSMGQPAYFQLGELVLSGAEGAPKGA